MGLPDQVLLDGDGRIVVGESGMPQVTNGEGGSCCCDGCSPLPKDMLDEFTGLDQEGNLFFTDDAVKAYPFDSLFDGRDRNFINHEPAPPYSAEQLAGDNAKYQLIGLKSGDGQNGGATNVLMWNGDDTCGHPWFYRKQLIGFGRPYYAWNILNGITNIKPSIIDNGFANYSPADETQGWSTSVELRYGDDTTSHGLAQSLETSQDEKPFMGFPSVMGVYTAAPLHRYEGGNHPATDVGCSIEVSEFSYVLPIVNTDFVEGGTEPYLDFPYVREYERHLKTVKLYYPLASNLFSTFGRGTRQQEMTFFLPIRSGDKLTIEVNPILHEVNVRGSKQTFCVRFLVNETTLAVQTASTQTGRVFNDSPATDDPEQNYYCSFGHGTILATNSRPQNYFEEWNKWAKANNPNFHHPTQDFFLFGGWLGRQYFSWPQDNDFDFSNRGNFKYIYVPTYAPFVGGFKNYNHTMQNEPLDFDCGQVNEPVPLVMQNFADATGRTIEAPPPVAPPAAPPATVVLTYPYNWANISTISATSFAAVVTGATSPLTFNVETGSLPSGLSLNTTTGLVSGTASSSGSGTISIKVTDTNSATDTSPVYSWNVTGSGGAGGGGAGGP